MADALVQDASFWLTRWYELPNFLLVCLFVLYLGRRLNVPAAYQALLLLHCFLPFVLNGLLFPVEYFGDQFRYWRAVNDIRFGGLDLLDALMQGNVEQAAALFALMPLPLAPTPLSLGFYNAALYTGLFFWLYQKNVLTRFSIWFFLLYPSFALYSALSLRDGFILVFMVMAAQFAREGRWWPMLAVLGPLWMIKFQNFFILAPVLVAYMLFGIRHSGMSALRGLVVLVSGVIGLVAVSPVALPVINFFRRAMYVENGGDPEDVQRIEGPVEFVGEGMTSGLYFLAKPFPWEASNALQLVQSAENVGILLILAALIRAAWRRNPRHLVFWLLFFIFALSVYGLVVFNYGTAVRYRYPFVVLFVIVVAAECRVHSLFKPFFPHWRRRAVA